MYRAAVAGFLLLLTLVVPAAAQAPQITIIVRDNQFVPAEVAMPAGVKAEAAIRNQQKTPPEFEVPAGVKVELVIRNEQKTPAEFESHALHREKVVPAGGTASIFVGPLKPGRYEFIDDFHPATKGVVVVK